MESIQRLLIEAGSCKRDERARALSLAVHKAGENLRRNKTELVQQREILSGDQAWV